MGWHRPAVQSTRVALEACCKALLGKPDDQGKTLVAFLKQLRQQGLLEESGFQQADMVRRKGNEAGHETERAITREAACECIDALHALLGRIVWSREG